VSNLTYTTDADGPAVSAPPPAAASPVGWWLGPGPTQAADPSALADALSDIRHPLYLLEPEGAAPAIGRGGVVQLGGEDRPTAEAIALLAQAPPIHPGQLGDAGFRADHRVRLAYMTGAMANGIASAELVEAVSRGGMLGCFGAAGLSVGEIERAIDRLQSNLGDQPFCFNLIHSPNEPRHEWAVADLYIRKGIRLVEASAYLDLTPAVVRYRLHGIRQQADGRVVTPNRIIAKASRIEVARRWFSPPPPAMVEQLLRDGQIDRHQAQLAARVPMAEDLTAEADSGGHTDNRPAVTLLPTLLALRDRLATEHAYDRPLRVGAAGGIGTPEAAAAAFAMGAAYIVSGSVNQACRESGSSDLVRRMLAETEQADVIMAPAADMFEMGVKLQVLKRGTMFAMRAAKLYEVYRACDGIDQIPATDRAALEKTIFRASLEQVWQRTSAFFSEREPDQVARAETDPKHKMALVFRWYLGLSSRWANDGEPDRQIDYQVWCGPAMGAFNEWTRGSFLADPAQRDVVTVAWNILFGAAVCTRAQILRSQGAALGAVPLRLEPRTRGQLAEVMR